MSTVTPTQPLVSPPSILAPLTPRRITVDEYERIIASGSLNEPKKVELIDGYMVTRMAKSAEHGFSIKEVLKAISFNMGNRQKHGLFEKKRDRELRKTELDCKKPRKIGHSCMLRGLDLEA